MKINGSCNRIALLIFISIIGLPFSFAIAEKTLPADKPNPLESPFPNQNMVDPPFSTASTTPILALSEITEDFDTCPNFFHYETDDYNLKFHISGGIGKINGTCDSPQQGGYETGYSEGLLISNFILTHDFSFTLRAKASLSGRNPHLQAKIIGSESDNFYFCGWYDDLQLRYNDAGVYHYTDLGKDYTFWRTYQINFSFSEKKATLLIDGHILAQHIFWNYWANASLSWGISCWEDSYQEAQIDYIRITQELEVGLEFNHHIESVNRHIRPKKLTFAISNLGSDPVNNLRGTIISVPEGVTIERGNVVFGSLPPNFNFYSTESIYTFIIDVSTNTPQIPIEFQFSWESPFASYYYIERIELPNPGPEYSGDFEELAVDLLLDRLPLPDYFPFPSGWFLGQITGGIYSEAIILSIVDQNGAPVENAIVIDAIYEGWPAWLVPPAGFQSTRYGVAIWNNAEYPIPTEFIIKVFNSYRSRYETRKVLTISSLTIANDIPIYKVQLTLQPGDQGFSGYQFYPSSWVSESGEYNVIIHLEDQDIAYIRTNPHEIVQPSERTLYLVDRIYSTLENYQEQYGTQEQWYCEGPSGIFNLLDCEFRILVELWLHIFRPDGIDPDVRFDDHFIVDPAAALSNIRAIIVDCPVTLHLHDLNGHPIEYSANSNTSLPIFKIRGNESEQYILLPINGTYVLSVEGLDTGYYKLYLYIYNGRTESNIIQRFICKGDMHNYTLEIDFSNKTFTIEFDPNFSQGLLIPLLMICVGFIGGIAAATLSQYKWNKDNRFSEVGSILHPKKRSLSSRKFLLGIKSTGQRSNDSLLLYLFSSNAFEYIPSISQKERLWRSLKYISPMIQLLDHLRYLPDEEIKGKIYIYLKYKSPAIPLLNCLYHHRNH